MNKETCLALAKIHVEMGACPDDWHAVLFTNDYDMLWCSECDKMKPSVGEILITRADLLSRPCGECGGRGAGDDNLVPCPTCGGYGTTNYSTHDSLLDALRYIMEEK